MFSIEPMRGINVFSIKPMWGIHARGDSSLQQFNRTNWRHGNMFIGVGLDGFEVGRAQGNIFNM